MNLIIDVQEKIYDINEDYIATIINKISNKLSLTKKEAYDFLSYIISEFRKQVPNDNHYKNKCDLAQRTICNFLSNINCNNHPCNTHEAISKDIVGHSFVICKLNIDNNEVPFLIDPTYVQFFEKNNCTSECLIKFKNTIIRTPHPGYFIKEEDKQKVKEFLENGYGELTDDLARIYGDSFLYTKSNIPDTLKYKININGNVYKNSFLKPGTLSYGDELSIPINYKRHN